MSEATALAALGAQVRYRRSVVGMTQSELAEAIGVARSSIANIEAGRQNTGYDSIVAIAAALGISVVELVSTEVAELPPARFNTPALYERLDKQRIELELTWKQVAAQARTHASLFSRMSLQGLPPNVDSLAKLLVWLGDMDIEPYIQTEGQPS